MKSDLTRAALQRFNLFFIIFLFGVLLITQSVRADKLNTGFCYGQSTSVCAYYDYTYDASLRERVIPCHSCCNIDNDRQACDDWDSHSCPGRNGLPSESWTWSWCCCDSPNNPTHYGSICSEYDRADNGCAPPGWCKDNSDVRNGVVYNCAAGETCRADRRCRRTYPETTTTTAPTNCGGNGRACCSGNTCNSGFTCQSGTCQVPPLWSPPASDAWITVLIRFFYPDGRPYNGGGLNGASIPVYLGFVLEDSCSWTSTWGDADAPTGSRRPNWDMTGQDGTYNGTYWKYTKAGYHSFFWEIKGSWFSGLPDWDQQDAMSRSSEFTYVEVPAGFGKSRQTNNGRSWCESGSGKDVYCISLNTLLGDISEQGNHCTGGYYQVVNYYITPKGASCSSTACTETDCADRIDNDGDGAADAVDTDCCPAGGGLVDGTPKCPVAKTCTADSSLDELIAVDDVWCTENIHDNIRVKSGVFIVPGSTLNDYWEGDSCSDTDGKTSDLIGEKKIYIDNINRYPTISAMVGIDDDSFVWIDKGEGYREVTGLHRTCCGWTNWVDLKPFLRTGWNTIKFKAVDSCSGGRNFNMDWNIQTNRPPTISSVTDSPDPVIAGRTITFTVDWNDPDAGERVKVHLCRTNSIAPSTTGGSCASGQTIVSSSALTTTDPKSETYTAQASDTPTLTYYTFVCDDGIACSSATQGTVTSCATATETACSDSLDNDCDAFTDCADSDCAGLSGPGVTCCQTASNCPQDDCKIESCTGNNCVITNRPAGATDECGTCQACNAAGGNCLGITTADGKNCVDDCTSCSSGTCTNRNQCAAAECSSGQYCDAAGGNCQTPDSSSNVCLNCAPDQTTRTWTPSNHQDAGKGFNANLFDSNRAACTPASGGRCFDSNNAPVNHKSSLGTGACCGDDANEYYKPDNYGPECTADVNDCVWSDGNA